MFKFLMDNRYFKYFLIQYLLSIVLIEWALAKLKPLRPRNDEDKMRDEKFEPFKRNDLHKVNRFVLYITCPLLFLRFFLGWFGIVICSICIFFLSIGHQHGSPYKGWKYNVVRFCTKWAARNGMMMMAIFKIEEPLLTTDYRKYLGPDWKITHKCPGTIVSNHQCFMDIIIHMYRQPPSHISKAGVRMIPFVGHIAEAVGCLFIDRGSKEARKDMLTMISDRQL